MTCSKFEPLIALYVEDDLSSDEALAVERHLDRCNGCRAFTSDMRESQATLKTLRGDSADRLALEQVRTEVLANISRRPVRTWHRYAAAAALLLLSAAGWLWRSRPAPKPELPVMTSIRTPQRPPAVYTAPPVKPRRHVVRKFRQKPRVTPEFKSEPLVVKMLTEDPQVVIYWLVERNGG